LTRIWKTCIEGSNKPLTKKGIVLKKSARHLFGKSVVSILSVLLFMAVTIGTAITSYAAEWELWPRGRGSAPETSGPKDTVPPAAPATPEEAAAAKAGTEGGKAVAAGVSTGTIGKAALIGAGILAIVIAVGSGGGGGTTSPPTCQ
jgi:hypothetical protein